MATTTPTGASARVVRENEREDVGALRRDFGDPAMGTSTARPPAMAAAQRRRYGRAWKDDYPIIVKCG
jgi:hypothetical protein